jgi:hypothetical protein
MTTSLVPYKSLSLSLVRFTPDVVQSVIRSSIALAHSYKRKYLFLTSSLLAYEASVANSIYSTLQRSSTGIMFPFFLIVHHKESFRSMQHKVICKLLLTGVCGRPALFYLI